MLCVCAYVHVCIDLGVYGCTHTITCVWKTEDNLKESLTYRVALLVTGVKLR